MPRILALSTIAATGANAQEVISGPTRLDDGLAVYGNDLLQVENRWADRETLADAGEVRQKLEGFGYDIDPEAEWLDASASFTLYSSFIGPGQVGYLVVPDDPNVSPLTYLPSNHITSHTVEKTGLGEDLVGTVLEKMKSSIASVCKMGVQPETITGSANAGLLQIAATWRGDDICAKRP